MFPEFSIKDWIKNKITLPEFSFWSKVDYYTKQKFKQFEPLITKLAKKAARDFRKKHPDIKPNSKEELEIAKLIMNGMNIE